MRKREPVLIYMEILAILFAGPRGPTRLAQACNLNYGRLENFTKPMLEKGLIRSEVVDGQEVLAISSNGLQLYREWLEIWRQLPIELT